MKTETTYQKGKEYRDYVLSKIKTKLNVKVLQKGLWIELFQRKNKAGARFLEATQWFIDSTFMIIEMGSKDHMFFFSRRTLLKLINKYKDRLHHLEDGGGRPYSYGFNITTEEAMREADIVVKGEMTTFVEDENIRLIKSLSDKANEF